MERHGGRVLVACPAAAITCRALSALQPWNGAQGGGESVHELQCWCDQRRWQRHSGCLLLACGLGLPLLEHDDGPFGSQRACSRLALVSWDVMRQLILPRLRFDNGEWVVLG